MAGLDEQRPGGLTQASLDEISGGLAVRPLGEVFYVSLNGSDTNPGNRRNPLLTITEGINRAVDGRGDIILVGSGDFSETLTITKSFLSIFGSSSYARPLNQTRILGDGITAQASVLVQDAGIRGFTICNFDLGTNGLAQPCLHLDNNGTPVGQGGFYIEGIVSLFGNPTTVMLFDGCFQGSVRKCKFAGATDIGIAFKTGPSAAPFAIYFDDIDFAFNAVADVATISSGITLGASNIFDIQFRNCRFNDSGATPVTDFINLQGTLIDVNFFDVWFSRAVAGLVEIPAGVVVLGRDPGGLVNLVGV